MQRIWPAVCLTLLAFAGTPAAADILIDNVDGMTLDANGRPVHFNGLVIDDAGRVARLLQRGDARPERPDFRQDGHGAVLIPGLIDAHGHVMELGFKLMLLDLSATRSLDEALAAIRQYAADNPETPWIMGSGWNQERWGLGRFPTATELDSAVGDRPVWLIRVDGHAGWANSRAMQLSGVTAATRTPDGGRIERVGGGTNSAPSGIFVDNAVALIEAHKPQPLARDRDRALALAQSHLLSLGVTATADMGTTIEDWQTYRRAGDAGRLNVRIISYGAGVENMALIAGGEPTPWLYDDHLRLIGVKLYLDGALGSRGAWLFEPYSDAAGQRGLPLTTPSQLRNRLVRASMDGFQVAIHAIGDAANAEALSAIEDVSASFTGDRRWRIEHAQIIRPEDLPRFGRDHIIASMQPVHQTSDRLMAEARLGEARLGGAYAWRTIHAGGARIAFGSDYPVESPDPFAGIAAAISRTDAAGEPFGGWHPEQAVSREVAMDGFTRSAAYAGFADDRIGTLMPGMRADFLLVDTDPLLASPDAIRRTRVSETWVGGHVVWRRTSGEPAAGNTPAPAGAGR